MATRRNLILDILAGLWAALDGLRRIVVNLVFLVLMILLVGLLLADDTPEVPEKTALVIAPEGIIVEQLSGDPADRVLAGWMDRRKPETLLRDLLEAIERGSDDDRVQALVLDLQRMRGAGLTKLEDLAVAIGAFRQSGKPVIATSDLYSRSSYHLASQADEVFLHRMGIAWIDGYGIFRSYYKDGLDRLEVDANVFRVGSYKSAVEPYLRDDMSPEAREAALAWMGDLWTSYLDDVEARRGLEPGSLSTFIAELTDNLRAVNGNPAAAALDAGLVDHVAGRDAVRDHLIEILGEDEDTHSFPQIGYRSYLEALGQPKKKGDGRVGVVVARGTILDGSHPPGTIGGDSLASIIRRARHDEDTAALVLRVDSGGGSMFASEVIRRELELTRQDGKPVVVSMGSVAASGGYYISMASDEIWASPNTITGSIGIFGVLPTFDKPLAKHLGVRVDGVGTTWLSGSFQPGRPMDPRLADGIQQIVESGYDDFITTVAEARGMTPEEVDAIGQGRVWSGRVAHELGLVDRLGGLDQAVESAAALAELGEDYEVRFLEKRLSNWERLAVDLLGRWVGPLLAGAVPRDPISSWLRSVPRVEREAELFLTGNDPADLYSYCFCDVE